MGARAACANIPRGSGSVLARAVFANRQSPVPSQNNTLQPLRARDRRETSLPPAGRERARSSPARTDHHSPCADRPRSGTRTRLRPGWFRGYPSSRKSSAASASSTEAPCPPQVQASRTARPPSLPSDRRFASHAAARSFSSRGMQRPRRVPMQSSSRRRTTPSSSLAVPARPARPAFHVSTGYGETSQLSKRGSLADG
jgi:hypothetical protein